MEIISDCIRVCSSINVRTLDILPRIVSCISLALKMASSRSSGDSTSSATLCQFVIMSLSFCSTVRWQC